MKKLLFVLPLSFCLGSETIHDATYKTDKYSELVSEFKEKVELFHDQMEEEFYARFQEAWEKKYPDIVFTDYGIYDCEWDVFLPEKGISKSSGKIFEWQDLQDMVMEVRASVMDEDYEQLMEILPVMQYRVNRCTNRVTSFKD